MFIYTFPDRVGRMGRGCVDFHMSKNSAKELLDFKLYIQFGGLKRGLVSNYGRMRSGFATSLLARFLDEQLKGEVIMHEQCTCLYSTLFVVSKLRLNIDGR